MMPRAYSSARDFSRDICSFSLASSSSAARLASAKARSFDSPSSLSSFCRPSLTRCAVALAVASWKLALARVFSSSFLASSRSFSALSRVSRSCVSSRSFSSAARLLSASRAFFSESSSSLIALTLMRRSLSLDAAAQMLMHLSFITHIDHPTRHMSRTLPPWSGRMKTVLLVRASHATTRWSSDALHTWSPIGTRHVTALLCMDESLRTEPFSRAKTRMRPSSYPTHASVSSGCAHMAVTPPLPMPVRNLPDLPSMAASPFSSFHAYTLPSAPPDQIAACCAPFSGKTTNAVTAPS